MQAADVRTAAYLTVQDFPEKGGLLGPAAAALAIGRATGTVYNKADPGNDSQGFLLEEAVMLVNAARDYRIVHAFCAACDHSAVPLADFRGTSDLALMDLMLAEQQAYGERANVIRRSLEDGRITYPELRDITTHSHAHIRASLELLARLEALADAHEQG